MKRSVLMGMAILLVMVLCGGVALAEEKNKSSWYIGFGVGTGVLEIDGETLEDYYDDSSHIDVGDELTFNFGIGAILNPKLHLGLDISAVRQEVDSDSSGASADYQINNYFAALSYYPMTKGFFIKVGGGLSALVYDYDNGPYEDSDTYAGIGYLVGLGYDFWLGKSFNLGIHAEYSKQTYSDSDAPDDTDFINLYLAFYWF